MTVQTKSLVPHTPVVPARGLFRPLGQEEVRITGGFWGDRQEVNTRNTLAHIADKLESEGWLPNFDLAAAGVLPDGRRGREFTDSEIYKYLEAMAWEIGRTGDSSLESRFRDVVSRVAAAQDSDGYLSTKFGRPGQAPRWSDLEWGHELYCMGHLIQAAVARMRTRPDADDGLADIAIRAADLICREFGADGRNAICGHAEIEVALAELARATGDNRYLDQARLFVERHGQGTLRDIEWGRSYFQDDMAVRDADVLRGHAVRANYLAAGAMDVAVDTNDEVLRDALQRQWSRSVARRTYVTGGQGSHHQDEAFGEDWELPADRAYSETCAGVGSIMFSWRLLLSDGDPAHADLIERTLFNVIAGSPAADGKSFFYANTLHQRVPGDIPEAEETSPRASSSLRAPWFDVSCCPPNVARTLASLDAYIATSDDDGVQIHQYAPATLRTVLPDGRQVSLEMSTAYPEDGRISITVTGDVSDEWVLTLRVPGWARGATLQVADESPQTVEPGYVRVRRTFAPGDSIHLHLPMAPRISAANPHIDGVRGCVVIERGPEVLAVESPDLDTLGVTDFGGVAVSSGGHPVERDGVVWLPLVDVSVVEQPWPYGARPENMRGRAVEVPLIRYHERAERGPSTMRVWLPLEDA